MLPSSRRLCVVVGEKKNPVTNDVPVCLNSDKVKSLNIPISAKYDASKWYPLATLLKTSKTLQTLLVRESFYQTSASPDPASFLPKSFRVYEYPRRSRISREAPAGVTAEVVCVGRQ